MKDILSRAMSNPDKHTVELIYRDQWGDKTKRVVSPIRWMDNGNAFLALCLGREEPRRFELRRCSEVKLIDSDTVLMPMPVDNVN
jgi:predicted DNA-binding transcriptional regulator YafY